MKAPTRSPAELLAPGRAVTFANVAEGAEGLIVSDLARGVAARPNPPAVSLAVICRDGARMQQLARALEFLRPICRCCSFRPGIASPTTGCLRMAASSRSG
jgi:transcription-repair coupling factor (superfamily II helicase)